MDSMKVKMEAQFNRAHISERDFEEAYTYLSSYTEDLPDPLRRALLVATIISYARPFLSSDGGSAGQATETLSGNPGKILTKEENSLHKRVLTLRNEAVAHSDYKIKAVSRVQALETGFLTQSRLHDVLSERIDINLFLSITKKMKQHCISVLFK